LQRPPDRGLGDAIQGADDLRATIGDFLLFRRVELISDPAHITFRTRRARFSIRLSIANCTLPSVMASRLWQYSQSDR